MDRLQQQIIENCWSNVGSMKEECGHQPSTGQNLSIGTKVVKIG